ncbi:hypothetical protein MTR_7g096330 [Medicago truncatula]|uniref:Uncharacterized protein n=1 Tax=Medicago truncatula TaxID=3880 RepID=A0A072U442_MEDTR|nr:hypothetical protein MTR_7g096330 [Medicago truncatula]
MTQMQNMATVTVTPSPPTPPPCCKYEKTKLQVSEGSEWELRTGIRIEMVGVSLGTKQVKNEEEMKHCILMRKSIEGEVVEKGLGSGSEKTMCFFVDDSPVTCLNNKYPFLVNAMLKVMVCHFQIAWVFNRVVLIRLEVEEAV